MPPARRRQRASDTVDFEGVEGGGGRRSAHLPEEEGPYHFQVKTVKLAEGQESGQPYLDVLLVVSRGKFKGKKVYENCSLQPKALFKLKNLMEAAGVDPGNKRLKIPVIIRQLTGKLVVAEVEDDEYNGKVKSIIADYVTGDDEEPDDDDEDEDEEEDDEEDEDEEEDEEEEEDDDDEPPARTRRAASRSAARAKPAAKVATKARPKTAAKAAPKKAAKKPAKSSRRSRDDDDDIDDIDLDDL